MFKSVQLRHMSVFYGKSETESQSVYIDLYSTKFPLWSSLLGNVGVGLDRKC